MCHPFKVLLSMSGTAGLHTLTNSGGKKNSKTTLKKRKQKRYSYEIRGSGKEKMVFF